MSNHADSSIEWYINWLAETRPDISPEQRVELAIGFVQQQQPPERPREEDSVEEIEQESPREQQRREYRLHKFIDVLLKESE